VGILALLLIAAQVAAQGTDVPSLEEMWRIIQQQQAEIDALKAENRRLRDAEAAPVVPSLPTTLIDEPIAANEREEDPVLELDNEGATSITFSGHAMLDMGYQTNQSNPDWFDVLRPTKLPAFDNEYGDDGKFYTSARQSRLGVSTQTPTALGDLKTLIEFELFGAGEDAGQPDHLPTAPRLGRARAVRRGPVLVRLHGYRRLSGLHRVLGPQCDGVLSQCPGALDALAKNDSGSPLRDFTGAPRRQRRRKPS
jgi:hypothetical protein